MQRIYLDHNATTPLAPEALTAMLPFLCDEEGGRFGNPSSISSEGRVARAAVDDARETLTRILGASRPQEIIFTSGGTEADNLAVIGICRGRVEKKGCQRHLITSATEHHAVLHAAAFLESREGFQVTRLPVDARGLVDLDALRQAITPQTAFVSIHAANNETGTIQRMPEIAAICREHGVPFHSDSVQALGKIPVNCDAPDALSLAAHKFYGPRGAGVLWVRNGIPIEPILFGGAQENERRPGTENVAAIVGMAAAAQRAVETMEAEALRQRALRERLWQGIQAAFPKASRNGAWDEPDRRQLANTLNVSFPGLDSEALLINFDLDGIAISGGSACMAGSTQPSHVLMAMGVPKETASIRFSLGKGTSIGGIKEVIERLPRILTRCLA